MKCRGEASQELWHSFVWGVFTLKEMAGDTAGRAGKRAPFQGHQCG